MHAVLNPPVSPHRIAEALGIASQARDVVPCFACHGVAHLPFCLDHTDTFEACPALPDVQVLHVRRLGSRPMASRRDAPMPFLPRFVEIVRNLLKVRGVGMPEELLDLTM